MIIIYHGECEDCKFTWFDPKRYESCPNCGLTDIWFWEERVSSRYPYGSGENRRLSDIK